MTIATADAVKQLRDRTGAGMMDCKTALQASAGDIEKAIDFLRKKGMAQVAKRAGREAKEGMVVVGFRGQIAAIVEANCETDFVARTDDFKKLTELALEEVLSHGESGIQSKKLNDTLSELSGKIGEKMLIRRAKIAEAKEGVFFSYIHSNKKLAVVVEMVAPKLSGNARFEELGKNLAMQVAASNPICVTRQDVPSDILEREKGIFKEEIKGKPENIIEKIVQGKLEKFYQTVCLLEQPFVKDDKISIKALLDQIQKELGQTIQIKQFVRVQLGETVSTC